MTLARMEERVAVRSKTVEGDATVSPGALAIWLMRKAQTFAVEELGTLEMAIQVVRSLSLEVIAGGGAFGGGERDLAARLAEDLLCGGKSLETFAARGRAGLVAH